VGGLVNCLVCERTRSGDNADLSLAVNVSGHNADLALSGLDDAGAVRANQARLTLRLHDGFYSNHI